MMGVHNKNGMRGSCRHPGEQSIRTIAVRILVCITPNIQKNIEALKQSAQLGSTSGAVKG